MSISSVTSSPVAGVAQQRPPGPGKEIRDGIGQLKKAIEAGDLDSVQKAYDSLSKLQSGSQSSSSGAGATGNADNPLGKMLTAVGDALKTGDIAQVQQAFETSGPKGAGGGRGRPGGAGGGEPPPGPPPDGGASEEVRSTMGSLAQSLQSGDLTSAQDSFSALAKLLGTSGDSNSDGKSSAGGATASSGTSIEDLFKTMLSNLGSALQSGDLSGAQKTFASMAPRGSQGVDVTV